MKFDVCHSKAMRLRGMLLFLRRKASTKRRPKQAPATRYKVSAIQQETPISLRSPFDTPSNLLRTPFEAWPGHHRSMWLSSRWHHAFIRLYTGRPRQRLHLTLAAKSRHYQPHDRPYPSSR